MDAQSTEDIVATFGKHLLEREATPVPPLILTHGFPFFSRVCEALENLQELYPYQRIWRSRKYGDEIAENTLPGFTPPSVRYRYKLEMEDLERQRQIETPPDSCLDDLYRDKTIAAKCDMPPTPVSSNLSKPTDVTPMASRKSSSPVEQMDLTIEAKSVNIACPKDTAWNEEDTTRPEDTAPVKETAPHEYELGQVNFSSSYPLYIPNEDVTSARTVPGDIDRRTSVFTGQTAARGSSSRRLKGISSVDDPREEEHPCPAGNDHTGSCDALKRQIAATECAARGLKRQLSEDERREEQQSYFGANAITGECNTPIHKQRAKRRKKGAKRPPTTV